MANWIQRLLTRLGAPAGASLSADIAAIPTTMRGTDNAALASVLGALDTAAATGAVSDVKMAMAYIKQIINELNAGSWTNLSGGSIASLDAALQKIAAILNIDGANTFSVDLDNSINTNLDALWTTLGGLIGTRGEAAHEGNAETAVSGMAYIKQLVNELRILDALADDIKAIALTIEESYLGSPTYGLSPIWEKLTGVKIDTTNIYNLAYNAEMGFLMHMWSNLCRWGQVTAVAGNTFTSAHLAGLGIDAMPAGWYVYVIQADDGAPEGEYRLITDYTDDGTVSHEAFSVALEVGDRVQLLHPVLGMLGQVDTAAAEGAVTNTDFMMAYVKQLVTLLIDGTYGLSAIHTDVATVDAIVDDISANLAAVINNYLGHGTHGLSPIRSALTTIDAVADDTLANVVAIINNYVGHGTHGLSPIRSALTTIDAIVDDISANLAAVINNYLNHATFGLSGIHTDLETVDGIVDTIKALVDTAETDSSYTYTDGGGEQDVYTDAVTTRRKINFAMDINAMNQGGVVKVYLKVDGSTYRVWVVENVDSTTSGGTEDVYTIEVITNQNFKVSYTEDVDETAARAIPYSVVTQVLE